MTKQEESKNVPGSLRIDFKLSAHGKVLVDLSEDHVDNPQENLRHFPLLMISTTCEAHEKLLEFYKENELIDADKS